MLISSQMMYEPLVHLEEFQLSKFNLDDLFYANINQVMPSLKKLKLLIASYSSLTTDMFFSLSQVKNLTHLTISNFRFHHDLLTDSGVCHLLDNCQQLKKVNLQFRSEITSDTFDKLIGIANNRPEERIAFECFGDKTILDSVSGEIANNLSIDIKQLGSIELVANIDSDYESSIDDIGEDEEEGDVHYDDEDDALYDDDVVVVKTAMTILLWMKMKRIMMMKMMTTMSLLMKRTTMMILL